MEDSAGIYPMPASIYHADPCPSPSLSSSIAKVLCSESPRHAWSKHPKLNPNWLPSYKDEFDLGTAFHDSMLEDCSKIVIVDAADWRTNAAKEQREAARAAGKVALLRKHSDKVLAMKKAVLENLGEHEDGRRMFLGGQAEQTLVWQEPEFGNIWCRARLDYLRIMPDYEIDDLKTTDLSANPETFSGALFRLGYDIQAAFYLRGLNAIMGHEATFRFTVVETDPPHAVSVLAFGPAALMLAEKKVRYAMETWQRCLETDSWPAYPMRTCYADLPQWEESKWLQKEGGL